MLLNELFLTESSIILALDCNKLVSLSSSWDGLFIIIGLDLLLFINLLFIDLLFIIIGLDE